MPLNLRPFLSKASDDDALDYNLAVLRDSAAYKVAQNLYRIVDPDDRRLASFPSFLIKLDKLLSQYALSQKARIEQEDGDGSQDDDSNNEDYDDGDQGDDSQEESDDSNDDDSQDDDSNDDSQDDDGESDDDSDSSDDEDSDLGDDQDDTDDE